MLSLYSKFKLGYFQCQYTRGVARVQGALSEQSKSASLKYERIIHLINLKFNSED